MEVRYDAIPSKSTTEVRQISQKLIASNRKIKQAMPLMNEEKEITGSRVEIGNKIYDLERPFYPEQLQFRTAFTSSGIKRIISKKGELIGIYVEIYLNE